MVVDLDFSNSTQKDIETFLLDTLDTLCRENTSESTKLKLLTILQEKVQWASLDVTSAEHVTGSLKNMYIYPGRNDGQLYKSQLLVTLTVVLIISSSKLQNLQENCETLHGCIQFLTDIISKVNEASSILTRKAACDCLWEIEVSYPGLLQDRLGCFFKLCEQERTFIFHSYMILFVTTFKNAIVHISSFQKDFPDNYNYLNQLLSSEADLSMKMNCLSQLGILEKQFPVIMNIVGGHQYDIKLPTKFKNKEIKRAVSFIAENFHFLTTMPLFHVLLQLMHCIKLASLSPSVFKSQFVKSLSNTMNLPLFHLVLLLKAAFGNQLFEESDSIILLQRLCHFSDQRFLGISQRLLCFQWLIHFPHDVKYEPKNTTELLADRLDFMEKALFHPTVFDPPELIPGKLDVLSCCYTPGDSPDIASATFMNCLVCLLRPIKFGLKRPYVPLLFQVLFSYYSRHRNSGAMVQELYRLLLSIATEHPDLVPYVLDFTTSVAALTPESYLPCEILRNFTEYILSLPLERQLENIRNFLKVFECAMRLKDMAPEGAISYLQQLAICDEIRQRSDYWFVGNSMLHVCRNILQYHDTSKIIPDLGECLLTMYKTSSDVDICDRAMFYYKLLTTISSEKCSRLLTGMLTNVGNDSHYSDSPGLAATSFPTAVPIKTITEPFLTLTSGAGETKWSDGNEENIGFSSDNTVFNIQEYRKEVNSKADCMSITIPYYLHYVIEPSEDVPDIIFAVVIQMQASSNYKAISDIHVPYLSHKNSSEPTDGCQVVEVKFSPREPVPASFNVRVLYSTAAGSSFIMALKPILIRFQDLFIPLCPNYSPELMFDVLWQNIEENQYSRKYQSYSGAKSIVYLDVEKEKVGRILEELSNYIVKRNDTESFVGVFLPPKHHFLLRFVLHPAHTVVHVATDRWQVLASLAEFLKYGRFIGRNSLQLV